MIPTFSSSVQETSWLGVVKGVVSYQWEDGGMIQIPHPGEAECVHNEIHSQLTHIANRDAWLGWWGRGQVGVVIKMAAKSHKTHC